MSLTATPVPNEAEQFATVEEAQIAEKRKIGSLEYAIIQKDLAYAALQEETRKVQ